MKRTGPYPGDTQTCSVMAGCASTSKTTGSGPTAQQDTKTQRSSNNGSTPPRRRSQEKLELRPCSVPSSKLMKSALPPSRKPHPHARSSKESVSRSLEPQRSTATNLLHPHLERREILGSALNLIQGFHILNALPADDPVQQAPETPASNCTTDLLIMANTENWFARHAGHCLKRIAWQGPISDWSEQFHQHLDRFEQARPPLEQMAARECQSLLSKWIF